MTFQLGNTIRRGKTMSADARKRIGLTLSQKRMGSDNPAWKGGITAQNKRDYRTYKYKLWRRAVLERDNKTCQVCGVRNEKGMEADHVQPSSLFPEQRFNVENGRTLCKKCHIKTETYGGKISAIKESRLILKIPMSWVVAPQV